MMKFEKNIEERKVLVKRLGELTGISPYYTKVPDRKSTRLNSSHPK